MPAIRLTDRSAASTECFSPGGIGEVKDVYVEVKDVYVKVAQSDG